MANRNALEPGSQLHWYVIKEVLGQGGFGITYLAQDTNLDQLVAIKEYLPTEFAVREGDNSVNPVSDEIGEHYKWGLDRFISEAKTLTKFKHHNIVRVLTIFTENNTAYMVMEYEHGQSLHEILKERRTLPENELNDILSPLLAGLEQVHAQGFVHRDIKPANIYLREDGSPVLLDFGSARQAMGHHTRTLTTMVSPGFAPFEQYVSKSDKQGPWTDIYGLGATLYRATTGRSPTDAMDRSEAILHVGKDIFVSASEIATGAYSPFFLSAIDHALCFKPEDRPQSIALWKEDFQHGYEAIEQTVSEQETQVLNLHEQDMAKTELVTNTESNTFQTQETIKVDVVEKQEAESKPSFFRRVWNVIKKILKWAAILFVVLVLLSLCEDKNKTENEPTSMDEDVGEQETLPVDIAEEAPLMTEDKAPDEPLPVDTIQVQINDLLNAAEEDVQALRLTTPFGQNAVEKYHQVIQLDSDNPDAIDGLSRVTDKYFDFMRNSIAKGDLIKAEKYFNKGRIVFPDHPGIDGARNELYQAQQSQVTDTPAMEDEIAIEEEDEPQAGLISDFERKAIERIQQKLAKNPNDKMAQRQSKRMAKNFERKVKKAIEEGNFDLAEAYVLEAMEIAPENKGLRDALEKIMEIRIQTGL